MTAGLLVYTVSVKTESWEERLMDPEYRVFGGTKWYVVTKDDRNYDIDLAKRQQIF